MTRRAGRLRGALAALLAAGLLTSCTSSADDPVDEPSSSPGSTPTSPTPPDPSSTGAVEPDLDLAVSNPVEDTVYPQVGDPGVDALHYDLDLAWDPDARRLDGTATITFRATVDAQRFQLDLARPMKPSTVTLDGEQVDAEHRGKELVVTAPVTADERYELVVEYAGRPRPVPAPTTRSDFSTTGFTVTDTGETWTMQEPFGAYTWYPVNDQPADKALYDITVSVPAPWTGVANGNLVDLATEDDVTTSSWQLTEPASSYLITLAIGDYEHTSDTTASGLRVDYWTPRGLSAVGGLRGATDAIDWIESRLGPYPFDSLGLVVTDSESAMETQTMVTLGTSEYVLSEPVIAHELVHQWYGDQVSPADWRDVWLNEGMTMLMQWLYEDELGLRPIDEAIASARAADQSIRDSYGPPGAYDPRQFGSANIYHVPAVMWNELRLELGDDEFFAIARSWPEDNDNTSATREQLYAHWEQETGLELSDFFDAWITGPTTPEPGVPTA